MKVFWFLSAVCLILLSGCIKNDNKCGYSDNTIIAPAAEKQALQDSLAAYGITASMDPSGFYYTISNQGMGPTVTNLCTVVSAQYKGGFFNGNTFDTTQTGEVRSFELGRVIAGWQKGLPLINKGGDITLYIPPSLGYGAGPVQDQSTGAIVIPGNSYLVFKIHVVDFQ